MIQFEEGDDHVIEDESRLPFRLLRNLGHGHSGNVEEVQNTITGAVFARKTIAVRGKQAKLATERVFQNEVKIIRGLNKHHHIIRVFATYMAKREVGLILQPVASDGDLGRFLETIEDVRSANVSDPRLERLLQVVDRAFGCLASGLTFMHQQRIRHKDIKPQNILVHQGSVIYTDFGYSLDSSNLSHSTTEGQPDSLTRRYSAPEVHEHGERNSSSDVFSLGCLYLELLAVKCNDTVFIPDQETFSADLDNIHRCLRSTISTTHVSLLCTTIISMTAREIKGRMKAADVMRGFVRFSEYCCKECLVLEGAGNGDEKTPMPDISPSYPKISNAIPQLASSDILEVASSGSIPQVLEPIHKLTSSDIPAVAPSTSIPLDASYLKQSHGISTDRQSGTTASAQALSATEWSIELGMYVRHMWNCQYQRAYREKFVQSKFKHRLNQCTESRLIISSTRMGVSRLGRARPKRFAASL